MLPVSTQAPGLSALADSPFLHPAELSSPRYRRWLDLLLARQDDPDGSAQDRSIPDRVRGRRRIRLTSPLSGTLARLP